MITDTKERWRDIESWEGYYQVSTRGRVRSLDRDVVRGDKLVKRKGKVLSQSTDIYGYPKIRIMSRDRTRTARVHRFVAETFIKNTYNKLEVNHRNADKTDNSVCNLEWCTHTENVQHAYDLGLFDDRMGQGSALSKLSNDDVEFIRVWADVGYKDKEVSEAFGVSPRTICSIRNRTTWKHL